ncbi:MAG TPA: glycoside hydrolase family 13 protein [Candidatus Enterenecus stercoripullorum]|nr:glycoside hydrolase family 13 protein [Candidatus Enterenecus stercoripullorum]
MEMQFNSLSERYKRPFGCLKRNEVCQLMVEVPKDCPLNHLEVVISSDSGYGMRVSFTREGESEYYWEYRTEFSLPRQGLYFFYFNVELTTGSFSLFRSGEAGLRANEGEQWQITCYPEYFHTPEAFQGAVLYQIFPDRFFREGKCDPTGKLEPYWVHDSWGDTPHYQPNDQGEVLNNDFFGGNLKGIETKLPYLKSLGVDGIYLNPVCMAFSNHRYDTADYKRVDPMLGTEADLSHLCDTAHKLGMKVILDGVFSHTGSNSVYFDAKHIFGHGAVSDPNSPYRSWYDFQHYPDQYTSWWGITTLPCVNEMNEDYLDFIIRGENSVLAHWLGLGIDGVRLDVADELPDAFIAALRKRLKEIKSDAWLLGEVWEDASNKISYGARRKYFSDGELDSVMNYPFRNAILSFMAGQGGDQFRHQVMTLVEHYPPFVLHSVMNSLSTHDTPRILTTLGDNFSGSKEEKAGRLLSPDGRAWAVSREKVAALLQFTLPGTPCIYYGDEVGMEGFEDPFNRRCYPWGQEDHDLLGYYQALGRIKHDCPALRTGGIEFQPVPIQSVSFIRFLDGQRLRILAHSGTEPLSMPLCGQLLLIHNGRQEGDNLVLNQWGGAIVLEKEC